MKEGECIVKIVPVYMIAVKGGDHKLLWATVVMGDLQLRYVRKILEMANSREDFNLLSNTHSAVLQETKEHVRFILDACELPDPGKETVKRVAGTVVGRVTVNKVKGWLCGK